MPERGMGVTAPSRLVFFTLTWVTIASSLLSPGRAQGPVTTVLEGPQSVLLARPVSATPAGAVDVLLTRFESRSSAVSFLLSEDEVGGDRGTSGGYGRQDPVGLSKQQQMTSCYQDIWDVSHQFTSWQRFGEPLAQWAARHAAGLGDLLDDFPSNSDPKGSHGLARPGNGPPPKVTIWNDENGITHTVRTPRRSDDTELTWQERHDKTVEEYMELFPEPTGSRAMAGPARPFRDGRRSRPPISHKSWRALSDDAPRTRVLGEDEA